MIECRLVVRGKGGVLLIPRLLTAKEFYHGEVYHNRDPEGPPQDLYQ